MLGALLAVAAASTSDALEVPEVPEPLIVDWFDKPLLSNNTLQARLLPPPSLASILRAPSVNGELLGAHRLRWLEREGQGRSFGGRSFGGRSFGGRSFGGRSFGGRSSGGRSSGGRSFGGRSVCLPLLVTCHSSPPRPSAGMLHVAVTRARRCCPSSTSIRSCRCRSPTLCPAGPLCASST